MGEVETRFEGASARPLEILLVEDNLGDVRLVVEALKHGKLLHRLTVAEDGATALAMLRRDGMHQHRRRPDLILLDLNLPGLSGHELLAMLKSDSELTRIPVVIMTSSAAHDDVARAYASHANCYVRKPVDIDRLLPVIHGIGHFWLSVVSLPEPAVRERPDSWRLLLIEDNPGDARLVQEMLGAMDVEIVHVERLDAALTELKRSHFTVVLADPGLPDSSGIDTISALLRTAPLTPLVVFSGRNDETLALESIQLGAQDYVTKGDADSAALIRGLRYAVERKLVQERLDYLATHDGATGLPNRHVFLQELESVTQNCHRRGSDAALMMLALSGLGRINRLHGHAFGDLVIEAVVARLRELLPADANLACTGSAEFSIILTDTQSIADTPQLAEQIIQATSAPGRIGNTEYFLEVNIGLSLFSIDSEEASALFKCAETALYQARGAGSNVFRFYSAQLNAAAQERLTVEHELHAAIEDRQFRLFLQPVLAAGDLRLCGVELLLRWQHPKRGLLLPEHFLDVAEQRGLMTRIGAWVIEEAARMAQDLVGADGEPLQVALNVSAQQLDGPGIVEVVEQALRETGMQAERFTFELTESVMQGARANEALTALRALGVRIAIDDFGTGYSSLAYLRRFPVDVLKIDRSFLGGVPVDVRDAAIVHTIIAMARSLGLSVIAEGVETDPQLAFLQEVGCDQVQGYLLGKPVDLAEFRQHWLGVAASQPRAPGVQA